MKTEEKTTGSNRLAGEKSPYLLQHADNPVNWLPWGEEAFEKAGREDKIIFVSIGYSTCHWCHVMERESFRDEKTAAFLNRHFVSVKVDREERPDVDKIYMDALYIMGQSGGWPLNMFLTPEKKPFFGGTYFPPSDRYGRSGFRQILETLVEEWKNNKRALCDSADKIISRLRKKSEFASSTSSRPETFDRVSEELVFQAFQKAFDRQNGGFSWGGPNKFPPSMGMMFLLRYYQRTKNESALYMAEFTCRKMLAGGIYDQIGGGLCRYSTDLFWKTPHFEKMLYDNALFAWCLVEIWQATHKDYYRKAAQDILGYLERDLLSPQGGFYSAEDADSEGEEGKFYFWSKAEVMDLLGEKLGQTALLHWGIQNPPERKNILRGTGSIAETAEKLGEPPSGVKKDISEARRKLLEARSLRRRPLRDDKILTSWNALAISAFAKAAGAFDNELYGKIALKAAEFIFEALLKPDGVLLRRYRDGEAKIHGCLNDYSQLALGCLDLFEYNYDLKWLERASRLMDDLNKYFYNKSGPYFETGSKGEKLPVRSVEGYDGVEPSGNSAAALAFLKLDALGLGDGGYYDDALRVLNGFKKQMKQAGVNYAAMFWAWQWAVHGYRRVIIAGKRGEPETEKMLRVLRRGYYPDMTTIFVSCDEKEKLPDKVASAAHLKGSELKEAAFVCENQSCRPPVQTAEELKKLLQENRREALCG